MEDDILEERVNQIQSNMHTLIDECAKKHNPNSKIKYSDYVTSFLIRKIAELELKIEGLV